ncbi:glycosyltransferase [Macrococcoides canis]|uniref:Glycosyl transferases group 1 n=1 Tax=Macrococcoides canis TaxID=1855823 RepID=A0A1W7AA95_9STAP|nr:glycosyltransferase [Macrococcus canis]ARQ06539.1 Glycosyl transferases group 1 [Macrococcus canis]
MTKLLVFGNNNSPHIKTWDIFYNNCPSLTVYNDLYIKEGNLSSISFLKEIYKVNKYIKDKKIDVVHTHSAGIFGLNSLFLNQSFILTIYGSELYNSINNPFKKIIMILVLKKAKAISCSSIAAQDFIKKNFSKSIYKKTFLFSIPANNNFINKKFKKRVDIFSNRRIGELYNTFEIIKSYEQVKEILKQKVGDLVLLDGYSDNNSYRDSIIKYVSDSKFKNNIQIISKKLNSEDLNNIYNSSKCFINIPHSDQLSLSFLEGVKTECIPIVSNIPAYDQISEKYNIKKVDTTNNSNIISQLKNILIEVYSDNNELPDFNRLNYEYNNINKSIDEFKKFIGDVK